MTVKCVMIDDMSFIHDAFNFVLILWSLQSFLGFTTVVKFFMTARREIVTDIDYKDVDAAYKIIFRFSSTNIYIWDLHESNPFLLFTCIIYVNHTVF